jgi:hypothetical protein
MPSRVAMEACPLWELLGVVAACNSMYAQDKKLLRKGRRMYAIAIEGKERGIVLSLEYYDQSKSIEKLKKDPNYRI